MDHFHYRDGRLHAEDVPLEAIAEACGTPCFVYARATLERHYRAFDEALAGLDHLVCYAVKANGNLAVLDVLARLGAGFDIVSGGELARVLAARGDPARVVFSGVGKGEAEMRRALEAGIRCFNVESAAELERLDRVARALGVRAPVSLRVNPDVDPRTHPYIATGLRESKFGIPAAEAPALYRRAMDMAGIEVTGIDCHIGSQLTTLAPFLEAAERVLALADALRAEGIPIRHLDLGGGLGIPYRDERPPEPAQYASALRQLLAGRDYAVILEPGRAIAGNAGVLLTRVEYVKEQGGRRYLIVDAAMTELIRPALYDAWHEIVPVRLRPDAEPVLCDVAGPVCESGDFLGRGRRLAAAEGDLLAVRSAGAYGFVMASNYNGRPRPAEVMVDGGRFHVVREREPVEALWAGERTLPRG
ncbi:diaminopimelate decarboxylase [Inmirania thermothiophila]|uniref:Diaminopimelate decarboxylase n=1 Tax=Inmirania thermothiophila TaxID=1750597 RepID=A0A3N1Y6F6_9GAMM|nr:diaminopimelate decarboxylase [Inmirania thermothiophila]ROR34406.1 diaminopimelate decarboxylase [Inmirania thermothiophila]